MKFTLNWLKKFLDTNLSLEQICNNLNAIGFEVESASDLAKIYSPFIVAEIIEAARHPSAEKLQVCKVNDGNQILQIVCGAANARAGIKVVLAPVGAYIPGSEITIKASQIRGVESNGMLCSFDELMLEGESDGIIELPSNSQVGSKVADSFELNDSTIEISLTPNRGDAASVYGIARDLAAKEVGILNHWATAPIELTSPQSLVINNAKSDCFDFCAVKIEGITNNHFSKHRKTLSKLGSSDKSALVDISNYMMLSLGRPNHIYDFNKLSGPLSVRYSLKDEKFVALGGTEFSLPEGLLVISDSQKICAIAGVMGGELSKVDENTTTALVEVASFSPESVMKSGRALNLLSDSRYRFERRVDYSATLKFASDLCYAIIDECGGKITASCFATGQNPSFVTELDYDFNYTTTLAGFDIDRKLQVGILERLGFSIHGNKLTIPSHRLGDITCKQDIAEEILRINGLEKVPSIPTQGTVRVYENKLDKVRTRLCDLGMNELLTWSFYSEKLHSMFAQNDGVKIDNPISSELSIMRQSAIATMLNSIDLNARRSIASQAFFEIGKVYYANDNEIPVITGVRYGSFNEPSALEKSRSIDFYDCKADAFAAIEALGFDPTKLNYNRNAPSYYHPGRSCSLTLGNKLIAYVGEIHPTINKQFDLPANMAAFEIFYENLPQARAKNARPKLIRYEYQSVERDFAFILDCSIDGGELIKLVKSSSKLITDAIIFDEFIDNKLGEGKKSLALRIKIQPQTNTLTEDELATISNSITNEVKSKLGGDLRS